MCAVAVRLSNLAWFRVGSDRYAKTSRTHGVTTLSKRHVAIRGTRVTFRFRAKHRAQVRTTLVDAELAQAIGDLIDQPGGPRLFRYRRNGDPFGERLGNTPAVARSSYVSPAVVEQYLDGRTIEDFRPRQLRVVKARDIGLDPEENALLSLLRSWRIRRARNAA